MEKKINIGQNHALAILTKYAEEVTTEEGNTYYRIPFWFQQHPGNFEFSICVEIPEDLSLFITKSGLGAPNPQIKKPKV